MDKQTAIDTDEDMTPAKQALMYRHILSEVELLRKALYSSLPKGSPEWHRLEHEMAEQARVEAEKRKADLIQHVVRALVLAVVFMVGNWAYTGWVMQVSKDAQKQAEGVK